MKKKDNCGCLTKQKISQSMIGNQNGLGHPCSEEKKKKISDAQKGRIFSEEHKQKLSEAAQNRHVPCSDNKKEILREKSYKRQVYCEELDSLPSNCDWHHIIANIGGHHIVAILDGKVHDIWDSTYKCIGNVWVKVS